MSAELCVSHEALEKETLILTLICMEDKKTKRGRPLMLDVAGDRRDIVKNIRFSKNEWDVVVKKMHECEMRDFSEYARLACMQVDPVIFDTESFTSLLYIKRDLKNFLAKVDRVDLEEKDVENIKKCFSALSGFLERIFNPLPIKII